jgi:hypothetical protein
MTVKRTMLRTVALGCLLAGTAAISGGTRPALAQDNASLNGVVLEQGTDRPLAGAIVAVIEGDLSVKTSPDGGFAFASLTVGDATLRVTLDGYASLVEPFGALPEGTTFVQLRLLPLAVAVEEIIASVPGFARNSAPGTLVRGTGDDPRT